MQQVCEPIDGLYLAEDQACKKCAANPKKLCQAMRDLLEVNKILIAINKEREAKDED